MGLCIRWNFHGARTRILRFAHHSKLVVTLAAWLCAAQKLCDHFYGVHKPLMLYVYIYIYTYVVFLFLLFYSPALFCPLIDCSCAGPVRVFAYVVTLSASFASITS